LQQIAIGGLNKGPILHLWTNIFGLPNIGSYTNVNENVNEDIFLLGGGTTAAAGDDDNSSTTGSSSKNITTEIEIDLMIPLNPTISPKVHTPPLNHIGLWVDDLSSAVHWMTAHGVRFTPGGIRVGASGYNVIFIHPKGNAEYPIGGEGVLIELVQAPPHVIEAFTTPCKRGIVFQF
jgi:lactoylglutathione lyase